MPRRPVLIPLCLLGAGSIGCEEAVEATTTSNAKAAVALAAEGAMCAEHDVLKAVCTKCKPNLAPIFQTKGDWCAAHGFPESFCPICHPERDGRPAAEVAGREAPPDGTCGPRTGCGGATPGSPPSVVR